MKAKANTTNPGTVVSVRGIALTPTQGLARGMTVEDTGGPLKVPVGKGIRSRMFETGVQHLDKSGWAQGARMLVEKPFGRDLAFARELNRILLKTFDESALFRIVQGRGGFYKETGAIRDVIQNHLFQVLTNLAMEPAAGSDNQSIRNEKVAVLKANPPIEAKDLVRGQFIGYRDEKDAEADSRVETHAAMRLELENDRGRRPFLSPCREMSACYLHRNRRPAAPAHDPVSRACEAVLARFAKADVDIDVLAAQLQNEGAASFAKSWNELIEIIASRSTALETAN